MGGSLPDLKKSLQSATGLGNLTRPDQTRPGLALVESLKASLGKEEVW